MAVILLLASFSKSLRNFRGDLVMTLAARGHTVHIAAPGLIEDIPTTQWFQEKGIECHNIHLSRTGLNPISDIRTLQNIQRLMLSIRPDYFIGYTIKPVIWGILAARICKVPNRVAMITGLGYSFTGKARGKRAIVRYLARFLYRYSLNYATAVFFQNPDDQKIFRQMNLVPVATPTIIVNGSGVDTEHYAPVPFPQGPIQFLLIARLLGDKGIREYAAAAKIVRALRCDVKFNLVGGHDTNPDGIPLEEVKHWNENGDIIWHGALDDVRSAISNAHVYVLPSYREGTPRTVLEAMSMGRPIITTDAPGCRTTVHDGENGFVVPVHNVRALADAMQTFLDQPDLVKSMGASARSVAIDKYDVHKVNLCMISAIGL